MKAKESYIKKCIRYRIDNRINTNLMEQLQDIQARRLVVRLSKKRQYNWQVTKSGINIQTIQSHINLVGHRPNIRVAIIYNHRDL